MAKPTTRQALRRLLHDEDLLLRWLQAGYTKDDRSRYRYRLKTEQLTEQKMEEILTRCDYTVAVEKRWDRPQ